MLWPEMEVNSFLDTLPREQLARLLYEILSRLLAPAQTSVPRTGHHINGPSEDARLVVDPTTDAWEHTGIYLQGYAPSFSKGCLAGGLQANAIPHFGSASDVPPYSLHRVKQPGV